MSCGARTYGAAVTAIAPGVAATFAIFELDGSATKKIILNKIAISGTVAVAVAVQSLRLTKLSAISTGGTATTGTNVPFASNYGVAATAVFKGYTVAPTGGGTVLGAIASVRFLLDIITTLMSPPELVEFDFRTLPMGSRPTLLTAAEAFALDYNQATPAQAQVLSAYAEWEEVPLNS